MFLCSCQSRIPEFWVNFHHNLLTISIDFPIFHIGTTQFCSSLGSRKETTVFIRYLALLYQHSRFKRDIDKENLMSE